ncbi:MAG: futalosine hydrolase [Bacteroidales bacterium]|jgi:futalosine hydrolase|nr:futalosine hydrolase [Bacteroidales bacterium]
MRILLVAATTFEIRPLLTTLPLLKRFDDKLSRYGLKNVTIDVLIPGVGMMLTAFHLGKQLSLQHYDFAINAGIAGTFNKNIPIGTVVNITEDCISDLGAEDGTDFLSIFELGLMDPDEYPYRDGRLINDSEIVFHDKGLEIKDRRSGINMIEKLPKVKGITVNTVHGSTSGISRAIEKFDADIESMEGAAFLYCCLASRVPCLQIRAISNVVEERDKSRWNMDLALRNMNAILLEMIKKIGEG